jgi:dihydrofolate reductase
MREQSKRKVKMIVCVNKDWILGGNDCSSKNGLLWHVPDELKFFKETTVNNTVVIGRKTYEFCGEMLKKDRTVIVLNKEYSDEELFKQAKGEIFICGGLQTYEYFLNHDNIEVEEIIVSILKDSIKCKSTESPIYFPTPNMTLYKELTMLQKNKKDFTIKTFKRKRNGI